MRSVVVVNEGLGRLFRRKDGKYLLYVPLDLAEDSMFPFKTETSMKVKVSFKIGDNKLLIEEWKRKVTSVIQMLLSSKYELRVFKQKYTSMT